MPEPTRPAAILAAAAPPRTRPSNYPEPFASRMTGREKRPLGDLFGLKSFGVNLTRLAPGGVTALHHRHSRQDEFVYVLEGEPVLVTERGETPLRPGMCAGFPAGGTPHHLENRGDRAKDDTVAYPADDLQAVMGADGKWRFAHKDGTPY
jgi:uncharacterized cupin superfamily protein